jgi:hypothetical protein
MIYIKEYEDEEIKGLMGDIESIGHGLVKGWVIMKHYSQSTYSKPLSATGVEKYIINFYVVGARTFEEAALIFHENAFPDTRWKDFKDVWENTKIKNEKSFMRYWVTEYSNHKRSWDKLLDADIVEGLKGKNSTPFFAKLDAENPFAVVSFLKGKFTNSEEAFTKRFGYGPGFTMEYKEF